MEAEICLISLSFSSSMTIKSVTSGVPLVMVPVLSRAMAFHETWGRFSRFSSRDRGYGWILKKSPIKKIPAMSLRRDYLLNS